MLDSRTMLILAQVILIVGAASLVPAAYRLFGRALELGLPAWWLAVIVPLAAAAGWAKARFVMRKRMVRNVQRLRAATGRLWPWQIYPPQLLAFILTMVVLMRVMRRVWAESPAGMGLLGGIDVAVAVALVVAASVYRGPRGAGSSGPA
ncbi:MAG: hypothetical protein IH621_16070 [Krumholzibacteria bacterium]|nr:hypothetical protein [Candidatus Krumholzibacteria bacterium]